MRRKNSDAFNKLARAHRQLGGWRRPVNQTQGNGVSTQHDLGAQDQTSGHCIADQSRHPLRSTCGRQQAQARLGQPDLRAVRDDPQITGQRQLKATAQRMSADFGDRHLSAVFKAAIDLLHATGQGDHQTPASGIHETFAHEREVGTGAKDFLTAAKPEHTHIGPAFNCIKNTLQRVDPLVTDGVDRRSAQCRNRHRAFEAKLDHG